ncbi:MAG TPA: 1,4-dihydroxy-2-naphthoate polyprenyltransferase [Streptosporangiaceae bacterium]
MTAAKYWVAGARPRTLPAAVVPVAVGSGVAAQYHAFVAWRAGLALIVALALQIGVNYANDYSDGIKGTDEQRVGPIRLVGSGLAAPRKVLLAAWLSFLVAGVAGLVLAIVVSWWLLALGAAAIAAAWFYTGGSRPYGYHGLGEVSVFVFFGLGAVLGTAYVQMERLPWLALGAAVPVGLIACALLVINNLRDIPTDEESGKRTLAVVLGDRGTRALYAGCMTFAYTAAIVVSIWAPVVGVTILAVPLAVLPIRRVMAGATGRDLIAVLGQTGRFQLGFGLLLTVGLAIRV